MHRPLCAAPTKREILLVLGLLVVLVFFSKQDTVHVPKVTHHPIKYFEEVIAERPHAHESSTQEVIAAPAPYALKWTDTVPETTLLNHVPGYTVFENLYALNGTLFIVTSTPEVWPRRVHMYSSGITLNNSDINRKLQVPSDKDMRIITPEQALQFFGSSAIMLDGPSWLTNDPPQFIAHYYHFVAELFLGLWRAYSSDDPTIPPDGRTTLPPPRRWFFTHTQEDQWRDYSQINQLVVRTSFPGLAMEFMDDWKDRAALGRPFVFEHVLVSDRPAATHGPHFSHTWRIAAEAFEFRGGPNWWAPIRRNLLEFSGLAPELIWGPDPGTLEERKKFVITYVSRQGWGRRMLKEADHERLCQELRALGEKYSYEVNILRMDSLSRAQQLQLAGRTTIMVGVHGNGLTSLLWMKPSKHSTVIEIFYPEALAFDYEWTARAVGLTHYAVWNNITLTRPNLPRWPNYPEEFQGNNIPVDGAAVAALIRKRLKLPFETDD